MIEIIVLIPLIFFIIQIGVYPKPFLSRMDATVKHLVAQVELKAGKRVVKEGRMVYITDADHVRKGE